MTLKLKNCFFSYLDMRYFLENTIYSLRFFVTWTKSLISYPSKFYKFQLKSNYFIKRKNYKFIEFHTFIYNSKILQASSMTSLILKLGMQICSNKVLINITSQHSYYADLIFCFHCAWKQWFWQKNIKYLCETCPMIVFKYWVFSIFIVN